MFNKIVIQIIWNADIPCNSYCSYSLRNRRLLGTFPTEKSRSDRLPGRLLGVR